MAVEVLIPAETYRLTTLEAVLREITLEDNIVFAESLIDEASSACATECDTILAQQQYRETLYLSPWCPVVPLRYRPLVRLDQVSINGTVLDPDDYYIESYGAPTIVILRYGWTSNGSSWRPSRVSIEYVAGFVLPEQFTPVVATGPRLPADLHRAAVEGCKVWFDERLVDDRIESRTLGDQSIRYGTQAQRRGLPMLSKDLLRKYMRLAVA